MNTYMDWVERRPQFRKLAEQMQRNALSVVKSFGVELERLCTDQREPTPCEHYPVPEEDYQLSPAEMHNHFRFCLSHEEQVLQLEQWREAAYMWVHQDTLQSQQGQRPHIGNLRIAVEPTDMCVHVVLRGNALTLADKDPAVLETITPTERAVAKALLFCAINELEG